MQPVAHLPDPVGAGEHQQLCVDERVEVLDRVVERCLQQASTGRLLLQLYGKYSTVADVK
ncbi:hypothetical protein [Dactylosporangium sp. CA-092794]|uniref:hypothetical protein n=1 Tax=Dactylosporangium sp. CA-092794 TaxID=3239929 RepID=UPI003D93B909